MIKRILCALLFVFLPAASVFAQEKSLPQVILLGDSIRMNYQGVVKEALKGKAEVWSPEDNCRHTAYYLENLDMWLAGKSPDLIHFNVGLHDMFLDAKTGKTRHSLETYEANLRKIVAHLQEKTDAKLIFALTTVVDEDLQAKSKTYGRVVRHNTDVVAFNAVARKVAAEMGVTVDDLHSYMEKIGPEKILTPKDGIHLSPEGCETMGKEVARVILEDLRT